MWFRNSLKNKLIKFIRAFPDSVVLSPKDIVRKFGTNYSSVELADALTELIKSGILETFYIAWVSEDSWSSEEFKDPRDIPDILTDQNGARFFTASADCIPMFRLKICKRVPSMVEGAQPIIEYTTSQVQILPLTPTLK